MNEVSQEVEALFASASQSFQEAEPDVNRYFPPDGTYECVVDKVTFDPSPTAFKDKQSTPPQELPGIAASFAFTPIVNKEDPAYDPDNEPKSFTSDTYILTDDNTRAKITREGAQKRAQIAWKQFNAAFTAITGIPHEEVAVAKMPAALNEAISAGAVVQVKITTNAKGYRNIYVNPA